MMLRLQKTARSEIIMSTKEKQKKGSGVAAVVIILCAAALAALAWVVYRQLCPAVCGF